MSSLLRSEVQLTVCSTQHVIHTHSQDRHRHILHITKSYFFLSLFLSFSLPPCPLLRENDRVYWLIISAFSFTFQVFFQPLQIGPLTPATLISALLLATPMDKIFSHNISHPTHTHPGAASCPSFTSWTVLTTREATTGHHQQRLD